LEVAYGHLVQVFCPICGISHGNRVDHDMTPGRRRQVINLRNFWTGVADFDPQHPFGIILGDATMSLVIICYHYYPPLANLLSTQY
jgi:hypothetical protein